MTVHPWGRVSYEIQSIKETRFAWSVAGTLRVKLSFANPDSSGTRCTKRSRASQSNSRGLYRSCKGGVGSVRQTQAAAMTALTAWLQVYINEFNKCEYVRVQNWILLGVKMRLHAALLDGFCSGELCSALGIGDWGLIYSAVKSLIILYKVLNTKHGRCT